LWSGADQRLVTPDHLAGLAREESPATEEPIRHMRDVLAASVPLDATVGALYADETGEPRSVLFAGGTGMLRSPEASLDKGLAAIAADVGDLDRLRAVPNGPRGGILKCGVVHVSAGVVSVCGWAEPRSLG